MKLSEMRQWLQDRDIQLTRSLGQNFLHDGRQLDRILAAAELQPGDRVLEIGPGLGPLTERLLDRAGSVTAIEKDRRLAAVLRERFADRPELQLLEADALRWLEKHPADWQGWKLVANLPYSVASPLLVELAGAPRSPDRLVVTLQLEVVRRLVAGPGTRDYGVLTLLVQLRYEPGEYFVIPSGCFFPEPDVESACVVMRRRETRLLDDPGERVFRRLVKLAFSQRRKMMMKLLKQQWPADRLGRLYEALGLDPMIRAEKVGLESFVEMSRRLAGGEAL